MFLAVNQYANEPWSVILLLLISVSPPHTVPGQSTGTRARPAEPNTHSHTLVPHLSARPLFRNPLPPFSTPAHQAPRSALLICNFFGMAALMASRAARCDEMGKDDKRTYTSLEMSPGAKWGTCDPSSCLSVNS